jgi:subfamily B ATP-binding cassette protein MsbA
MRTYLRLLSYARPFGRFAVPYFIFSLIGTIFGLFQLTLLIPVLKVLFNKVPPQAVADLPAFAFKTSYVIDTFNYYLSATLASQGKFGGLKFITFVIVGATVVANVFRYLAQRVLENVNTYTVKNLREAVFAQTMALHIGYFSNEKRGDILSRITTDVREVENSVAGTMIAFLKEPVMLITYFVTLFTLSTKLTFFTLIIIPLSGLIISTLVKRLRKDAQEGQESLSTLTSIIDETLGGLRVIKAFSADGYVRKKFNAVNDQYAQTLRSLGYRKELAAPISEIMAIMVLGVIILYGGSLILSNESELEPEQFIVYIALFSQLMQPIKGISSGISFIQRGIAAGKRVFELIDAVPQVTEKPQATPLFPFSKVIQFKNVSFAYEQAPVLQEISFSLTKGACVALVGPSGGGKSTIADLIPRFYDVSRGSVSIDGTDIRDCRLDSLRAQIGVVTQESILFNDTIFNNIAFGNVQASREEVEQAAKIANAHEFIMATENGYQTVIGDRGAKLSGGQRQRLSIARAVFKNPPILILDEATSALDTESEKLVQEALANLMKDRTTLVIAHRLSTVQHADEILVIQRGRIVERGTHATLLHDENGLYRRLNLMQTT